MVPPQLGIMLCGIAVDSTVIGGPAYNSRQLDRGDVILRVDGVAANQAGDMQLLDVELKLYKTIYKSAPASSCASTGSPPTRPARGGWTIVVKFKPKWLH